MSQARPEAAREARPRRWGRLVVLAVLLLAGCAGFLELGTWQVHRRAWKLDLIARVDARVHAPPVAAPGPADWPKVTGERDEYRRVALRGVFQNDKETFVQAATDKGAGFWVMTPLRTDQGFTVLVNRGFVPPENKAAATRAAGQPQGETSVVGLVRMTEPGGGFLRHNAPAQDRWYSRDVAAIAARRGLGPVAPYFVDADATPNPGGWPVGGLTVISFPNSHLVYAITWYGLALLCVIALAVLVREELRRR